MKSKKQIKKYETYIFKNKARASAAKMAKSVEKMLNKIDRLPHPKETRKPYFKVYSLPITSQDTLVVENLEIGYEYPILSKLNFKIHSGEKTVITGFNGIGKSTLLKTLIGEIPKISGSFKFAPNISIEYFKQDLDFKNPSFNPIKVVSSVFPKLSEKEIRKYLAQCGIKSKNASQPVNTLSGGEQSKVKLCILMLTKCNTLILDEPTNHLDVDSKNILKEKLLKWEGFNISITRIGFL